MNDQCNWFKLTQYRQLTFQMQNSTNFFFHIILMKAHKDNKKLNLNNEKKGKLKLQLK